MPPPYYINFNAVTLTLVGVDTSSPYSVLSGGPGYTGGVGTTQAAPGWTTRSSPYFPGVGTAGRIQHDDTASPFSAGFPQTFREGVTLQYPGDVAYPDDPDTVYVVSVGYSQYFAVDPGGAGTVGVQILYQYTGTLTPYTPPPPPPVVTLPVTPIAGYVQGEDAHGRPVLLTPNTAVPSGIDPSHRGGGSTSINSLVSNTAGKNYLLNALSDSASGYAADNFGADNPCLLVDRRSNHFRALYSLSPTYIYGGAGQSRPPGWIALASGLLDDFLRTSVVVLPNISGGLCAAAQHPTDADYALLVYSDIGTPASPGTHDLKAAFSLDAGATWQPLRAVLPGLDLTTTGRPALCWLGNTVILVYSVGRTLHAVTSPDRGQTWTPAVTVSTYSPSSVYSPGGDGFAYFCLSLAAQEGQAFLLTFAGNTQKNVPSTRVPADTSPRLFVSGDGGQTWTLRAAEVPGPKSASPEFAVRPPGVLPAIPAPSGIGVWPSSGRLRLDTRFVSGDGGLSWTAP